MDNEINPICSIQPDGTIRLNRHRIEPLSETNPIYSIQPDGTIRLNRHIEPLSSRCSFYLDANLVTSAYDPLSNLGLLSARDWRFAARETAIFRKRAERKQAVIQRELAQARRSGDYNGEQQCLYELQSLNRKCWNFASILKAKILVRTKGTERSGSKSGYQALCTHVIPIFESDTATRWLIGLLPKLSRALRVSRNMVNRKVPQPARAQTLSGTPSFEPCAV